MVYSAAQQLGVPMNVCIVSSRFYPQLVGSGTSAYLTARELARNGHRVTVLVDAEIQKILVDQQTLPFTVRYIPQLEGFAAGKAPMKAPVEAIFKEVRSNHFDVIHVHNFMPMLLVSTIREFIKSPIVFTFYNTPSISERAIGYYDNAELDLALAKSVIKMNKYDHLIVGSKTYLESAIALGADLTKTTFCYTGIDLMRFSKNLDNSKGQMIFKQYFEETITDSETILLLPGRVTKRKGILETLEAIAEVKKTKAVKLLLTGMAHPFDPDFADIVRGRIKDLQLDRDALVPAKVISYEHVPYIYQRANIVIVPSYYEGLGLTAIEALATSKPLITTNVPGLREVAKHGQNAVVIKPKRPQEITDAIRLLLSDQDYANELAKAGPASVEKFSISNYVHNVEQVYSNLTRNPWKRSQHLYQQADKVVA